MDIDSIVVKKIAHLSRIKISDDEVTNYELELGNILNWVNQLNEVNTDHVTPLRSVIDKPGTPLREDIITAGGIPQEVLKNAPVSKYGCFVVPKVVE